MSNGPSLSHKKSKRKKKKVKGHHQGPSSMSLCPPSTSQPQPSVHTEVIERGEDALEVLNIGKCTSDAVKVMLSLDNIIVYLIQRWATRAM